MTKEQQKAIDQLQAKLIKNLGWGSLEQWHSSMFAELSEKVFNATGVSLSQTTLKRFFGTIKYDGAPSISTLDALSVFLGSENWRAFKLEQKNQISPVRKYLSTKIVYSLGGVLAAVAIILLIANNVPDDSVDVPEGITFASKPLTNTYPNSVVFDFDLKDIKADSLKIQQYWDPKRTIEIQKDQKQATGIYYFPGYFRAKLVANEQIITEHDLFLKSNGWLGTVEYRPVPKYFNPETSEKKLLYYPNELLKEVSMSEDPLSIIYHYVNDLGDVSGDNFHFKTIVRNTFDEKWAVCQTNSIYFLGTKGALIIPFTSLGCSSDINLYANDVNLNGKKHDLSSLGTDISDFTSIEIINDEKSITIKIEGKKVYQVSYNESIGNLAGIRFRFLGLGEVKNFEILDQNGATIVL